MERSLYLIRHAETSEKRPGETDLQRTLTPKGIQDALDLQKFVSAKQIKIDVLLHSPAKRTTQTASILNKALSTELIEEKIIYTGSAVELIDKITRLPSSATSVAIVGHNPTISWLAAELCVEQTPAFAPCSVVGLTFYLASWKEIKPKSGKLILIKNP